MSGHLDPTDLDAMLKRLHLPSVRRQARFPFLRTIEEFDFTFQNSIRLQMLGKLWAARP
ncbi:MAG: hypothetical protein H0X65_19860 [Gemmatimonadetes bacterium]|nr:hypothetical protein [Gemmatimonadota bacterium]